MTAAQVRLAVEAALVVAVVVLVVNLMDAQHRAKAAEQALAGLKAENTVLAKQTSADAAALAHKDTVKITRQIVRADSSLLGILDSLKRVRPKVDSLHDTVTVERRILVQAHEAIDSAKAVGDACCKLAHDWKARWVVADSMYRVTISAQPNLLQRRLSLTAGYGLVYHSNTVVAGPTIAVGFKVWP